MTTTQQSSESRDTIEAHPNYTARMLGCVRHSTSLEMARHELQIMLRQEHEAKMMGCPQSTCVRLADDLQHSHNFDGLTDKQRAQIQKHADRLIEKLANMAHLEVSP